jgi:hypothetical protein
MAMTEREVQELIKAQQMHIESLQDENNRLCKEVDALQEILKWEQKFIQFLCMDITEKDVPPDERWVFRYYDREI